MDAINALSVDLEEYFQVSNFDGVIPRESWDGLPSRVGGATERLLDLFDRTESRATFFVLGWVAERQPGLVRAIAEYKDGRRGGNVMAAFATPLTDADIKMLARLYADQEGLHTPVAGE